MSRRSRRSADDPSLPVVSLVGRPNVGKSSLFNRLVGGQPALVEDMPGVTRDRRYGVCDWSGVRFRLTDTGGLDPGASGILGAMRSQTLRAVEEAAVLILVLDVKEGITPVDQEVAQLLRRTGKPVLVAANKVDSATREPSMGEVFRLGFDQIFAVSAAHGRGVGDLLDATVAALGGAASPVASVEQGDPAEADGESAPIRLAFVGKPNVGKSSLVNRLLGEERVLVHDQPGTTRDPIDTPFTWQGREFVLVDTAGLRRRRAIDTLTEKFTTAMNNDFDTPLALMTIAQTINLLRGFASKHDSVGRAAKENAVKTILELAHILCLLDSGRYKEKIPEEAKKLVARREQLRKEKKFDEADVIRKELKDKHGVVVEDTEYGTVWYTADSR